MNNFFANTVSKYNYIRTSKCVLRYISLYINFTIILFLLNIISNNIFPKFLSIACRKKKKKNVKNNFSSFNKLHAYPISNFLTDAIVIKYINTSMIILVYQYFQIFFSLYSIYLYNIYHNPISFEYSAKYSYSILHPSPLICIDT